MPFTRPLVGAVALTIAIGGVVVAQTPEPTTPQEWCRVTDLATGEDVTVPCHRDATTTSTTVTETTTTVPQVTTTTVAPTTTTTTTTTTLPPVTLPPPSGVQFVETFDTPSSLDRFDFAVHHAWTANSTASAWPGDHDETCGGADTRRIIRNPTAIDGRTYYRDLIAPTSYWCKEHLMTSFNTNHYAQVDFAPKATFTDVRRVCWDQSRTDMGSRHWTQLAVVPLDTFTANNGRLDYVASRFSPSGPGKYGLHPRDDTLLVEFGRGVPRVQVGQTVYASNGLVWNAGADRMSRFTTCVIDTGAGVRIELERPGGVDVYTRGGGIPDGPVRVIFQQDLYNPDKAPGVPGSYSVHWDNVVID